MNERPKMPGERKLSDAEIKALLSSSQEHGAPQQVGISHPPRQQPRRQSDQGPATFSGQGFGPRAARPPYGPPAHVPPGYRYPDGRPAFYPPQQPHTAHVRPGQLRLGAPVEHGYPHQPASNTDHVEHASINVDSQNVLGKLHDVMRERVGKKTKIAIGVLAAGAVATWGISAESDRKDTTVPGLFGLAESNEMTFTEPDCFEPVIKGSVYQESGYILNYKNIIVNKDELDKAKNSKNYEPLTIDSFDDEGGAIRMQSDKKPATPFSKNPATVERLPVTRYDGNLNLGMCNKSDMSEVVSVDGSSVEIDASKLAFTYNPSDPINKKAIIGYEKYAPKTRSKSDPGYISDKEYTRIRKKVIPNEKDPALNNSKFDNAIIASTLKGLKGEGCLDQVQAMGRKYFELFLRAQQPDKKFTISWKGGGFVMPDKDYSQKSSIEKDVKIMNSQTKCETFSYESLDSKDK